MQIIYNMYCNWTGYSISSQDYILSMLSIEPDLNIKVNFLNKSFLGVSKNRQQLFVGLSKRKEDKNSVHIYHSIPHRYRRPEGSAKCIGICLFETINPPKNWVQMMNKMDAVITASSFNKNIFKANGVTVPIHVVPHCFDTKMFNKDVTCNGRYGMTTFLSMGTWKKRKNWENLVRAFYETFEEKDRVCLLIKTEKPKDLETMVRRIRTTGEWRSKKTAPIYAEQSTHCNFEDIPRFMRKGDIYINPSLGEGFGLPGFQSMALGIPLITTRFGGVLEYAKPDLCNYIEPHGYKTYPIMDGIPQFNGCVWPIIRMTDIKDAFIRARQDDFRSKAAKAYEYVHNNFNYNKVGIKMLEAIK